MFQFTFVAYAYFWYVRCTENNFFLHGVSDPIKNCAGVLLP